MEGPSGSRPGSAMEGSLTEGMDDEAMEAMAGGYGEQEDLKEALREAQRAWIRFRDAECDFRTFSSRMGSIYPTLRAGCLEDLTRARTEQLREAGQCEEGDLSCNR